MRTPQKGEPPSKLGLDTLAEDSDDEKTLMIREAAQQTPHDGNNDDLHAPVEVQPLNFNTPRSMVVTPTPSIQPITDKPRVQVHENPDEDEEEDDLASRRGSEHKHLQPPLVRQTPPPVRQTPPENRKQSATPQPAEAAEVYNGGPAANLRIVWPDGDDDEEEEEEEEGPVKFNVHGAHSETASVAGDNPPGSTNQGEMLEAELVERAPSRHSHISGTGGESS
jgi:hypothetical protein